MKLFSQPGIVYDSAERIAPWWEELASLLQYRELVVQFVARTIKARYKRSWLGVVWTMLNPLLTMVVLTLVFSRLFRFSIDHYPVYVLSGLTAWSFFSSSTNGAMGEMLWSGNLLRRIYVPRSVFVVSAVGTGLFNLVIALVPLLAIALVTGVPLRPALLAWPAAIFLLSLFSLGIGLLLAAAVVYFADMLPVYEVLLTIWLYATPIIYSLEIIPVEQSWIFRLNPLYYLVTCFRAPLLEGKLPDPFTWLIASLVAIVSVVFGVWVFTRHSHEYAYRI